MNNRLGSALWLVVTSAAWVFTALLAAGALVMSPMIFTSQKVVQDPWAWGFIAGIFGLLAVSVLGLVLQWVLFAIKRERWAVGIGALPVIALLFLSRANQPSFIGQNSAYDQMTVAPTTENNHRVRIQTHCPGLDDSASLHLTVYPFLEGAPEDGLPMAPLGNSNWEVEFMYPTGHVVLNYRLDDQHRSAAWLGGAQRPNIVVDVQSDTLLLDTVAGWMDALPPPVHLAGEELETVLKAVE